MRDYNGYRDIIATRPDTIYGIKNDGLYISKNCGASFTKVQSRSFPSVNPYQLNVCPSDPLKIVLANQETKYAQNRFYSHNGGRTWHQATVDNSLAWGPVNGRPLVFRWGSTDTRLCQKTPSSARERAIFLSGKDVKAGDVGSIVDADGCSQTEKEPLEARSSFLTEPNTVWSFGSDWATRSTDGGKSYAWTANGINNVMIGGFFNFNPHFPHAVFLAFQDYNSAFSTDGGRSWKYCNVSGFRWGGMCYGAYAVTDKILFCGMSARGWHGKRSLRISFDGGDTWDDRGGVPCNGMDVCYGDPTDNGILFYGSKPTYL